MLPEVERSFLNAIFFFIFALHGIPVSSGQQVFLIVQIMTSFVLIGYMLLFQSSLFFSTAVFRFAYAISHRLLVIHYLI